MKNLFDCFLVFGEIILISMNANNYQKKSMCGLFSMFILHHITLGLDIKGFFFIGHVRRGITRSIPRCEAKNVLELRGTGNVN